MQSGFFGSSAGGCERTAADGAFSLDLGFFLYLAWPVVMPYYLVKTRGAKGLLIMLGFVAAYVGAAIIGIVLSVVIVTMRS
jgi:hypothetical protein